MSRLSRSMSRMQSQTSNRWRRSTKWIHDRRRQRLAIPPPTPLETEVHKNGVFEIHLAGGDRRNVLGRSTIDQLEALVGEPPDGTRVIVITAAPPDFCAGYDLVEAAHGDAEALIANEKNFEVLRESRLPIVAALQGNVIGGGLELALSADVRVASPETRLALPASKLGLVYSEAGVRLVVAMVGESVARALFLAGRDLNADTALAMGLVTDIVGREQLRGHALALADQIASWSLVATSGNRQILDVVAGRTSANTDELRLASFAPDSDLRRSIAHFVARRSRTLRRSGTK
ncbi:MAG TPA: enoyl-CoA hydratase/isomerase family protein [Acidimicrobiales bacterium]|nr:enoyl-CoA hydratase/isomerase family protein [Acidimicrobiales bacterium]